MGGIDKLLAPVGGRPLLSWTLAAIAASPHVDRIVVVTAAERVEAIAGAPWLPPEVDAVIEGGETRPASVAAGVRWLEAIDPAGGDRPVLVHDGARPLVSPALVSAVAEATARHGAAIPVLPVTETIKRVGEGRVLETVDRSVLAAAQTPQGARRRLLLDAWRVFPPDGERQFTDEAALLEACTIPVHAIPGEPANLKVTLPDDLRRVEQALAPWRPSASASATTATRSGPARGCGWAGWRSRTLRAWPATPTATWPSMPWPTRCSAPPVSATSGACSPPMPGRPGASRATGCCARSWRGWPRPACARRRSTS